MATEKTREAVARAICGACEERPDSPGDAAGNQYRWQDYLPVADAAIAAIAGDGVLVRLDRDEGYEDVQSQFVSEAVKAAEAMRSRKIASLKKQIANLEKLGFE